MELPLTRPKKTSKLTTRVVIFPLILLTIAPILYLLLGYPVYYSFITSSITSSSSSSQSSTSSPRSSSSSLPSSSPSIYEHSLNSSVTLPRSTSILPSSSSSSLGPALQTSSSSLSSSLGNLPSSSPRSTYDHYPSKSSSSPSKHDHDRSSKSSTSSSSSPPPSQPPSLSPSSCDDDENSSKSFSGHENPSIALSSSSPSPSSSFEHDHDRFSKSLASSPSSWHHQSNWSSPSSQPPPLSPSSHHLHDNNSRNSSSQLNNPSISSSPQPPSSSSHDHDHHLSPPPSKETPTSKRFSQRKRNKPCDLFTGEWVPNPETPYYTNTTCSQIHEHQNCMKYGRPDTDFMNWRWKPDDCELPVFDPYEFLEIMRGKSMAFVGDSVSRNHMQSLICLLSRVAYPEDVSLVQDFNFQRWKYMNYNFTIATFWTTHLVRSEETGPTGPYSINYYNLYLDEPDPVWTSQIGKFDYVIISSGQWFFRPLFFFDKRKIVGCLYCYLPNVRDVGTYFGFRRAFRTALRAIVGSENFKGDVFLRTFAPSHFENGEWNKGGNCLRTRPYRRNETALEGANQEVHNIQIDEFKIAKREAKKRGLVSFRLLDTTQAMLLRPDGHPSRFGHRPEDNVILYNDCVHWCLPGPIDSWNDLLLEMLKTKE